MQEHKRLNGRMVRSHSGRKPFVSVIIPTYNRKNILEVALRAISEQDYPSNLYEVIVVDDGSDDGTKELVLRLTNDSAPKIRYYFQKHKGFRAGQARNLGARHAQGEILIFLDSDVASLRDLVSNHVKSLEGCDCVLGYAAGFISKREYNISRIKNILEKRGLSKSTVKILPDSERLNDFYSMDKSGSSTNPGIWKHFFSVNFSIRKDLFERFEFNPAFVGWGLEDIELGYSIFKGSYKIEFNKNCIGLHLPHDSNRSKYFVPSGKISSLIKNMIVFYKIHPDEEVKSAMVDMFNRLPRQFLGQEDWDLFNREFARITKKGGVVNSGMPDFYSRLKFPEKKIPILQGEAEFIYSFLKQNNLQDTLEIGLGFGTSAAYIISASGRKHYVIDPLIRGYGNIGMENLRILGLNKSMTLLKGLSGIILPKLLGSNKSFDFIFIDGDHKYDSVFTDFYYSDLLLRNGGYILFHDLCMRSVQLVASWIKLNRLDYRQINLPLIPSWNMILFQRIKSEDNSGGDHFNDIKIKNLFKNHLRLKILHMYLDRACQLVFSPIRAFILRLMQLFRFILNFPLKIIGLVGRRIKRINPDFYYFLKGKNGKRKTAKAR